MQELKACPWVIIPVHNRAPISIRCIQMIASLQDYGYHILVVDDGSTDGSASMIKQTFPDVTIMNGNGCLFWTGAIELGMRHAHANKAACFLWLNDDATLSPRAIKSAVAKALDLNCLISGLGCIQDVSGNTIAYHNLTLSGRGGLRQQVLEGEPTHMLQVDSCRGNLVAIPRSVVEKIGFPDGKGIPHMMGDSDYTLRATKAGFKCFVDPYSPFIEELAFREDNGSWLLDSRSPLKIFRQSLSIRGSLYPQAFFRFHFRHWKIMGIIHCICIYLKLLLALLIKACLPKRLVHFVYNLFKQGRNLTVSRNH